MKTRKTKLVCFFVGHSLRKIFAALLVLSFSGGLLLTGCGSKETEPSAASSSESAEKSGAKPVATQPTAAQEAAKQRAEAQGNAIHAAAQAAHGTH